MDYLTIRYECQGRVAIITYDRQERRNAWNLSMYREIVHAIERANADEMIGAIVVTNDGPIFCSGTDFKAGTEIDPETGRKTNVAMTSMAMDTSWLHLLARSKPTIGAIRGAALGMGVTQILPFDIRMGGESSTYAFPFVRLSVMPELGCTALLPRLVGYGRAVGLCLTAATLNAREAERVGLITTVDRDDRVLQSAIETAEQVAGFPALQVSLTRELLRQNCCEHDYNVVLKRETDAFLHMFRESRRLSSSE